MSNSDGQDGYGAEPRKVWINKLLNKLDSAWYPIFVGGPTTVAIRTMRGVILDLDAHSKEKNLAPLLKQLFNYENSPPKTRIELEVAYGQLMNYLHSHHLKEYDRGITDADFEALEREGKEEE